MGEPAIKPQEKDMPRPKPLSPAQKAYIRMYYTLRTITEYSGFTDLPVSLQDEVNSAKKEGGKWL